MNVDRARQKKSELRAMPRLVAGILVSSRMYVCVKTIYRRVYNGANDGIPYFRSRMD